MTKFQMDSNKPVGNNKAMVFGYNVKPKKKPVPPEQQDIEPEYDNYDEDIPNSKNYEVVTPKSKTMVDVQSVLSKNVKVEDD